MNVRAPIRGPQSAPSPGWLAGVDRDLVALARGAGALRLALGDGLALLRRTGGAAELGFPDLGAYTLERLGRRRRWAEDTARVAEQLAALPLVRAALAEGHIGWSMAELLGREATAETEATLLATARTTTVRGMRAELAAAKAGPGSDDDPPGPAPEAAPEAAPEPDDERCTLQLTVDRITAWAFELTRRFLAAQTGASSDDAVDDAVIEALLAEALASLQVRHPELKRDLAASARAAAWDQQRELARRLDELTAEGRFHQDALDPDVADAVAAAVAAAADEVAPLPREPVALDAHLRDLNTRLQRRDGRLGELARRLWEVDGWHHLGYASPTQYAHERLGCSLAAVKARMTLDRRCDPLPEVAVALDDGAIGFEAARLVSRVADRDTVRAWLDRAAQRTVKHLKEEVEAVATIARAEGAAPFGLAPPDDDTLAGYLDLERAMLDGTVADLLVHGGQMSGDEGADPSQMSGDPESAVGTTTHQDGAVGTRHGAGRVALRLRLGSDLVAFWRDVERLFRDAGEPGEFADFLVRTFWHVWLGQDEDPSARVAYQDVYERERFRCASPVCDNRDLTPHHLVFRSHGGGEERSNLVGLCVRCHLELLHQGRLRAAPPADDMVWTLGREGLMTVHGRARA